jgi:hypothetical protein
MTGVVRDDLADLLDHELIQLPDMYRTPIVLCELEGINRGEAAERLGWPEGTVSGRLSRSKAMLVKRLTRRGVRLSDGALTVLLAQDLATASSSLPTPLLLSTIKGASPFGAGRATASVVSSEVAALTEEVLKASLYCKIRNTTAVLLASTLAKAGLWQVRTWVGTTTPGNGGFRVPVDELIRDDMSGVTRNGIETLPEVTADAFDGGDPQDILALHTASEQFAVREPLKAKTRLVRFRPAPTTLKKDDPRLTCFVSPRRMEGRRARLVIALVVTRAVITTMRTAAIAAKGSHREETIVRVVPARCHCPGK